MDPLADTTGRRVRVQRDLQKATTDEEACPPLWLDLMVQADQEASDLQAFVSEEAERFAAEPDIRAALARRAKVEAAVRIRVAAVNRIIGRLNHIAPLPRFQRVAVSADELVRPLYRTRRQVSG